MTARGRKVAVVGGGITGLAAAHELVVRGDHEVVVVEAGAALGGKIQVAAIDGAIVETGADSFVARDERTVALCASLGLEDELVEPAVFGALVWTRGRLARLPPATVFGMPVSPGAALTAPMLSPTGRLRAGAEPVLPGSPLRRDVPVADFVSRRFGPQVLDRMVDPVLAGTRAGDPRAMSLAAALPQVFDAASEDRSVMLGLRRRLRREGVESGPPPFLGLRDGMHRLVEALAASLGPSEIVTNAPVEEIAAIGDTYELRTPRREIAADAVILATPAFEAARLLALLSGAASSALAAIPYAAVALVILTVPAGSIPYPGGSGILVPSREGRLLAGCTWFSVKWPHRTARDEGAVVRCFVGRATGDRPLPDDDRMVVAAVRQDLSEALGVPVAPRASHVARWERSLPEYTVGHLERVSAAEAALRREHPRLALAGAGYRGSGIPDCIAHGTSAARSVADALERDRR